MRMKAFFLVCLLLASLVPAYADSLVNMTLTGNGANGRSVFDSSNQWGGEPISPYEAQIGNLNLLVACLDLTANTTVGQSYSYDLTANVGPSGDYTELVKYQAAAILMEDLLGASGDTRGELSFAIWRIFNQGAVDGSTNAQIQANLTTIKGYADAALTQARTGHVPSFNLYYPASNLQGVQTPPGSQRYIQLVPDGGMTLMLLGGALVGLATLRRKFCA